MNADTHESVRRMLAESIDKIGRRLQERDCDVATAAEQLRQVSALAQAEIASSTNGEPVAKESA